MATVVQSANTNPDEFEAAEVYSQADALGPRSVGKIDDLMRASSSELRSHVSERRERRYAARAAASSAASAVAAAAGAAGAAQQPQKPKAQVGRRGTGRGATAHTSASSSSGLQATAQPTSFQVGSMFQPPTVDTRDVSSVRVVPRASQPCWEYSA